MKKEEFIEICKTGRPVIAMIHLYGDTCEEIFERAKVEISICYKNGMIPLVENYTTYNDPEEKSMINMRRVLSYLKKNFSNEHYGVNFLYDFGNDAVEEARLNGSAFAEKISFMLAEEYGASFVQAESVCGHVLPRHDEKFGIELNKLRDKYNNIAIVGGVEFKYQPDNMPDVPRGEKLVRGANRCDVIVASGCATGEQPDIEKVREFRKTLPEFPMIIGSGLNMENVEELFSTVKGGGIIGSDIKQGGIIDRIMCEERVAEFLAVSKAGRQKGVYNEYN